MKTLITNITISDNTVWLTYDNRGNSYKGFTPYKTFEEAMEYAKEVLGYNFFNSEFICEAKGINVK